LYKAEWLDLVFDHRNKAYGAYGLRRHYGRTMAKAMSFTFMGVAVLVVASIIFRPKPEPIERIIKDIPIAPLVAPPVKAEIKKPDQPKAVPQKPAAPVQTTKYTTPVIVPTDPPVEPPATIDLKGAIGPEEIKVPGDGTAINTSVNATGGGGGNGTADAPDVTIHTPDGLEVMPEPVGGAAAWAKFLQKNLRFPGVAQENGVSGRVIPSFVIEKDGSLSNIVVDRKAGYGFDEEALRVLKLAKAWKPGIQNGQPVRVKYTIPINFQLSEQ
jgi:protein TonB